MAGLHALVDADATCGGKAAGLARLRRAGLPVPDGFVLDDGVFRALVGAVDVRAQGEIGHVLAAAADRLAAAQVPADLEREVRARAAALGVVAVRSSATIEDGEAGAAAGVFSSRRAVPATSVWDAIRAVWTSALTPLAAAYARQRGGVIAIGVIVQRFIAGERLTVYTRPPGGADRDEVLVQRGDQLTTRSRHDPDPVVVLAIAAEAAIGARAGADVELIAGAATADAERGAHAAGEPAVGPGLWIVQARPIVHPVARPRTPPPPPVLAALVADGRRWTWDVTHNPDPLSPAQAGLVERVDRAGIAPWSLRVCAGYLYAAPRGAPPVVAPATTAAELAARVADLERAIERALGDDVPPLAEAIARYLAFYRIWACELGPLLAATRATLPPAQRTGARPSAVEATLLAAARGELDEAAVLARLGALAPAWDVAVPTFGERPELVRDAITRARALETPSEAPSEAPPRAVAADERAAPVDALARAAADLGERDDAWFARAQLLIRRALHARAHALGVAEDDLFWLPLDEVVEATALDADDARRRAAGARAAAARAARWAMPVIVGGPAPASRPALRGVGTGPRVTGRVVRFASLAAAVAVRAGDVVVTQAVTPALAVFVLGCAALVSETGGLLDHGAALARELGIPCVVGCHDAWLLLADGMLVTVDGDAGAVIPHPS